MLLKTLTVQNFLSIRNITLELQDRGLTLIKGLNQDNPEFDNNGSGKSSLIEALVYALYGRTVRGLKGDSIVHNIPKKNTKVFLDIVDDDGTQYRIARYRKHSINKNKSLLYRNGKDITPKSENDFNDYVANLLQADYLTFTSSLLYSAESFKFTSATDAEMKSTFDLMLGLDVFSKCLEITKSRLREVESTLSSTEWKIKDREDKIVTLQAQIEDALKEKSEYKRKTSEQVKQQQDTLKVLKKDLEEYNKDLADLEKKATSQADKRDNLIKQLEVKRKKLKEIDTLKSELQSMKSEKESLEQKIVRANSGIKRSENTVTSTQSKIGTVQSKIDKYQSKISDLLQRKTDVDKSLGEPCPTCGQPMTEKALEPAKQEYDEKVKEVKLDIEDLKAEIESFNKDIKSCKQEIDNYQAEIENYQVDIAELQESISEFEGLIQKSKKLIDEVDDCEQAVDEAKESYFKLNSAMTTKKGQISQAESRSIDIETDIKNLLQAENPYDVIIQKYQDDLKSYQKDIAEFNQGIQDKLDEKQCLLFWQQAYSNQGIKSLILDDITPFLNRRVNKYLTKLTSGHIEVKFSTQTTLKSGESREKFSIEISNKDGGSEYAANSGGERRRVDLAINLALQDLVASRSTKQINIAIFDEVMDTLDDTGVENVMELLKELSKDKSTIFVISHNSHLQSYFDSTITVVKRGGFSTLLGESSSDVEDDE